MSGSALPHQHAALQDKDAPKSHELQADLAKLKTEADGSFKRQLSSFRQWIEPNGEFAPEKGRYHLYVSYSCPWATRTLIVRKLKGLEDFISVSAVSPHVGKDGWSFADVDAYPGADKDPLNGAKHLKDIYFKAKSDYGGRFTVPVLWDKQKSTIVNNESSEIIRMLNTAFNHLLPNDKAELDFYPENLRTEIDSVNDWVYDTVNNGVYKSGFASTQQAYEAAVIPLFQSLDRLEKMLEGEEYLIGNRLTEADIRLFVTIVRFDPVYYSHFKCNLRTIREGYPNLHLWMRKLYWNNAAFKDTCNFDHIKVHYYWSQVNVNPTRIVPIGPEPYILPL